MPARVKNINAFDLFLLKSLINLKINGDYSKQLERSQKQKLCRNYYGADIDKKELPEILINISEDRILRIMPQDEEISRDISIRKLDEFCKILKKNYSWHSFVRDILKFRSKKIKNDIPFDELDERQRNAIMETISRIFNRYKKFEEFEKEVIDKIASVEQKNEIISHPAEIQGEKTNPEIKLFANRIYIELVTRKAAIPINEDKDVIEEIYNSWYKIFCIIRDELKTLPAIYFKDEGSPSLIIELAMKILNEVLRPHLTEHQAKYRDWLQNAKRNPKYKNLSPQELQRKYPGYQTLMISMKKVNKMLIENAEKIYCFMP